MAKKLYLGEGNNSNKVSKLYIGEQNTANKIAKAYIGVDNKSKQFWPSQIIYLWDRYTIEFINVEENIGNRYLMDTRSPSYDKWNFYWGRSFPNVSGFDFDCSNFNHNSVSWDDDSGKWTVWDRDYQRYQNEYFSMYTSSLEIIYCTGFANVRGNTDHFEIIASGSASLIKYTRERVKGNYVDEKASTNPNAYPKNGISGNYWYVYKGQQ